MISFWRNFDKNNIGFFGWEWYNSINRVWYNSINPLLSALHKSDFDKNWISVIVDVDEAFKNENLMLFSEKIEVLLILFYLAFCN